MLSPTNQSRRRFLGFFSSVGLSTTLLPGVLWARLQQGQEPKITLAMLKGAALVAGLDFNDEELAAILDGVNQNLERFDALRKVPLANSVPMPLVFIPAAPVERAPVARKPLVLSARPAVRRPANVEMVASWPLTDLAHLVKTRQVKSIELTEMYLDRLKRYNPKLNCVVTFTDDLAKRQAARADTEIAAGRYRGVVHGIPWGVKDIIAARGYPTTWGSNAFKNQMIDSDATVVRLLHEAGAVLVAKLATGEAGGDQWFGGRTNNPWDPSEGSSGSSAGSASATAAGLVGFSIGEETSGSILSPSSVCGVSGLRPTYGRVSCAGMKTGTWTQDRIGPLCRAVEDCAAVLHTIARPDGVDYSVTERPFNWDATTQVKKLRVGYLADAFDEDGRGEEWKPNDRKALEVLRSLGITLIPFRLPDMPLNAINGMFGVESAAAFDEFVRSRRDKELGIKGRGDTWRRNHFIPAVEYLQAQRVRGLIMRQLAEVTAPFDAYVAPYLDLRKPNLPAQSSTSLIMQHFVAANLCGYPAINVPNGFTSKHTPTAITFLSRPYAEAELLTLAKAYQDATTWHLQHPSL